MAPITELPRASAAATLRVSCLMKGRALGCGTLRSDRLVATAGALVALGNTAQNAVEFLARHVTGDWGELPVEDRAENHLSLQQGFRLLSSYRTSAGDRLWVITEADRSVTTILLPEEY